MKKLLLLLLVGALLPVAAAAQAPAAAPAPATAPAKEEAILPSGVVATPPPVAAPAAATATLRFAPAPETPAANPNAIKVKATTVNGRLTVKTDNPGPTRVELTDVSGRPVMTRTMMNGQTPTVLNVRQLPAGTYIVNCSAYEKSGTRQVLIGQ